MEYRTHIVQLLIVSCLATVLCKEPSSSVDHESIQLRRLDDRKMVGPSDPGSRAESYPAGVHPPKHVMKLMQHLSKNGDLLKERGNTVRSNLPNLRFACNEPTYVFSIKRFKPESLRAVELHYFASRPSNLIGSKSSIGIHLHLIANTSSECQPIGVQHRPAEVRGWQVIDVTAPVVHLVQPISKSKDSKITVGVSFRLQETGGSLDSSPDRVTYEKILSNHARPFLLIYAEEDDSSGNSVMHWTQEGVDTKTAPSEATHPMKARSPTQVRSHTRHTRSVDDKAHSVMTNEFPEDNTNVGHQATFKHFNEQDSNRRKANKRTSKKRKRVSKKKNRKAPLLDHLSSVVEEDSEEEEAMHNGRDQNTILPLSLDDGPCKRHPMFVGFDTIDWDVYVIAPSGFEAFYCTGACSFPLSKADNPSNHATIQSVMSVAGIQAKIPPPCCVPEKLSPISILFLDESNNVVLKTYKNMVVESCGCR